MVTRGLLAQGRRGTAEDIGKSSCGNPREHLYGPPGYIPWHEWAQSMQEYGYVQRKCPDCKLYVIWEKKSS